MNKFETTLGGHPLSFEFGRYAEQANGSCLVRYGDTVVLVCATMAGKAREGIDFFPLSCDFEEKQYAVGKIPGGFIKREGRPSEKAVLTCRLMDRPLRPLFPKGMRHDVQVVATVLSVDKDLAPAIPAMIGASAALTVSDIPFGGPIGAVNIGLIDDRFIVNPSEAQEEESLMHLTVAGTKDAVLMVEAGAKEVSEAKMLEAILFAHEEIKKLVAFQLEVQAEIGKEKKEIPLMLAGDDVKQAVRDWGFEKVQWCFETFEREERQTREDQIKSEAKEHFEEIFGAERLWEVSDALYGLNKAVMRGRILEEGVRPDGRKLTEVRPIWCEVGLRRTSERVFVPVLF